MSDALKAARAGLPAIDNALRYAVGSDFDGAEQEYDSLKAARLAFAALLAEHEALLRRVAEAPVREVIAHHVQGRDLEAIGFKWDEKPLPSLIGQRVRILAEPGEVGET